VAAASPLWSVAMTYRGEMDHVGLKDRSTDDREQVGASAQGLARREFAGDRRGFSVRPDGTHLSRARLRDGPPGTSRARRYLAARQPHSRSRRARSVQCLIQLDQLALGSGLGPSQRFCSWDTRYLYRPPRNKYRQRQRDPDRSRSE